MTRIPIELSHKLLLLQLAIGGSLSLAAFVFGGLQQAVSAGVGALLIFLSTMTATWFSRRIFEKKSIALVGAVIVIKYALLGVILYWISRQPWLSLAWLSVGVGSVILTALASTMIMQRN